MIIHTKYQCPCTHCELLLFFCSALYSSILIHTKYRIVAFLLQCAVQFYTDTHKVPMSIHPQWIICLCAVYISVMIHIKHQSSFIHCGLLLSFDVQCIVLCNDTHKIPVFMHPLWSIAFLLMCSVYLCNDTRGVQCSTHCGMLFSFDGQCIFCNYTHGLSVLIHPL